MSLANIGLRLEVGWYRQTEAIEHDARLLAVNAALFHGRSSGFAADAAGVHAAGDMISWAAHQHVWALRVPCSTGLERAPRCAQARVLADHASTCVACSPGKEDLGSRAQPAC